MSLNITFLIGNGFDIGLGLKTRYKDFYKYYCKPYKGDSENIKNFKETLIEWQSNNSTELIDWADFECAFGKHSNDFNISEKEDYLERFEDFVIKFNAYIEEQQKRVDYSKAEEIGKKMYKGVTEYFMNRKDDIKVIEKVYGTNSSARKYNFISFNYTNTVDKCADMLRKNLTKDSFRDVGDVLHIHGYIEKNMIIGVDNPSQILNPDFANDTDIVEEIVKPRQNANSRENYENDVIPVINKSNIICVYGMSLGDTDKKWWNIISKWLSQDSNHVLVIMNYDEDYDSRFIFNFRKFDNSVRDRFLSYSDLSDEIKGKISKRIFVGMNNNVFEIRLCHEESTSEDIDTILSNSLANV